MQVTAKRGAFSLSNALNKGYEVKNYEPVTIPAGKIIEVDIGLRIVYTDDFHIECDRGLRLDTMLKVEGISLSEGYAPGKLINQNLVIYMHNLSNVDVHLSRGTVVATLFFVKHELLSIMDTNSSLSKYTVIDTPSTVIGYIEYLLENGGADSYFPQLSPESITGKKAEKLAETLWQEAPAAVKTQLELDMNAYTEKKIEQAARAK